MNAWTARMPVLLTYLAASFARMQLRLVDDGAPISRRMAAHATSCLRFAVLSVWSLAWHMRGAEGGWKVSRSCGRGGGHDAEKRGDPTGQVSLLGRLQSKLVGS